MIINKLLQMFSFQADSYNKEQDSFQLPQNPFQNLIRRISETLTPYKLLYETSMEYFTSYRFCICLDSMAMMF